MLQKYISVYQGEVLVRVFYLWFGFLLLCVIIFQEHIDFGEHEGKSILEVADTMPEYYDFLTEKRNSGKCSIRRSKDKIIAGVCGG